MKEVSIKKAFAVVGGRQGALEAQFHRLEQHHSQRIELGCRVCGQATRVLAVGSYERLGGLWGAAYDQ